MQRVLAARVRPGERHAGLSGGARDDGDGALAARREVRQDEPRQADHGEDVEVEEVSVHAEVGVLPPSALTLTRVVEEDVELNEINRVS